MEEILHHPDMHKVLQHFEAVRNNEKHVSGYINTASIRCETVWRVRINTIFDNVIFGQGSSPGVPSAWFRFGSLVSGECSALGD